MTEDGEEQLQLSASTFAALQEFYNEEVSFHGIFFC